MSWNRLADWLMTLSARHHWFFVACLGELALLALALTLGWLLDLPTWEGFQWRSQDALWGCLAAAPMVGAFVWMLHSAMPSLARIRDILQQLLDVWFAHWTWSHLVVISLIASVAEETLFRAVIQGGFTRLAGSVPGLLVASLLFGLCHFVTPAYAVIAAVFGCYLGLLWLLTGNLLTPMVTHALYDFVALACLLRKRRHDQADLSALLKAADGADGAQVDTADE